MRIQYIYATCKISEEQHFKHSPCVERVLCSPMHYSFALLIHRERERDSDCQAEPERELVDRNVKPGLLNWFLFCKKWNYIWRLPDWGTMACKCSHTFPFILKETKNVKIRCLFIYRNYQVACSGNKKILTNVSEEKTHVTLSEAVSTIKTITIKKFFGGLNPCAYILVQIYFLIWKQAMKGTQTNKKLVHFWKTINCKELIKPFISLF